jgi:hypothetical protein
MYFSRFNKNFRTERWYARSDSVPECWLDNSPLCKTTMISSVLQRRASSLSRWRVRLNCLQRRRCDMNYYVLFVCCSLLHSCKNIPKKKKKNCGQSGHQWTSGHFTCPGACQKSCKWATQPTERKEKENTWKGMLDNGRPRADLRPDNYDPQGGPEVRASTAAASGPGRSLLVQWLYYNINNDILGAFQNHKHKFVT